MRRIQQAQERGFLDARCKQHEEALRLYGRWCWRMSLPMIWLERPSRYSRFTRVRLDMMTTHDALTVPMRAALIGVSAATVPARYASIDAYDAVWNRVPNRIAADFAHSLFRAIRRSARGASTAAASAGADAASAAGRGADAVRAVAAGVTEGSAGSRADRSRAVSRRRASGAAVPAAPITPALVTTPDATPQLPPSEESQAA